MTSISKQQVFTYDHLYEKTQNQHQLIVWLQQIGLLGDFSGLCSECSLGRLSLNKSSKNDLFVYRCTNRDCNKKKSIRSDSWFAQSHLSIAQIIKFTYYWVYKLPQEFVSIQLGLGSDHTMVDWYNFAREVCISVLEQDSEVIGGPGIVVEIDESKFGKRKYNRGRRVDGCWVFGAIERESKKCFFTTVQKRDADTLIPIIRQNIRPGSIIHSDCWKAYCSLEREGYTHFTVNHSEEFVNSATGANTQVIESTWHALKRSLPKNGTQKTFYQGYFF
jgi:transposase-like protein